jgi:lipopolysaccharide/colanic/teichoic acid biosynthesis glycosyltransferase
MTDKTADLTASGRPAEAADGAVAGRSLPYRWAPPKPLFDPLKRCFDIAIATAALVVLSPVWIAIGVLIKLSSPGPILFASTVVGRDGKRFTWYKFRSMLDGDDTHHTNWLKEFVQNDTPFNGRLYKVHPDPRVTKIGALLRRFSLDEVPQFINVLRGEMSVVGPRPPILFEYNLYDDDKKRRLALRPGITGLYQVTGRSYKPFSGMLATDLDYIRRRSLLLDLKIMVRTVGVMISGKGAA